MENYEFLYDKIEDAYDTIFKLETTEDIVYTTSTNMIGLLVKLIRTLYIIFCVILNICASVTFKSVSLIILILFYEIFVYSSCAVIFNYLKLKYIKIHEKNKSVLLSGILKYTKEYYDRDEDIEVIKSKISHAAKISGLDVSWDE